MTENGRKGTATDVAVNGENIGDNLYGAKLAIHERWIAEFVAECGNYHRFKQQP